MNHDMFVLDAMMGMIKDHVEYMKKVYVGTICTDDDGDKFEITGMSFDDGNVSVTIQSIEYGYHVRCNISKITLPEVV